MAEAPQTLEGWYALHEFRAIDWGAWHGFSRDEQERLCGAATSFLTDAESVKDAAEGSTAIYAVMGHKADILILHLRSSAEELLDLQVGLASAGMDLFSYRSFSYFSVTELGQYTGGGAEEGDDPKRRALIDRRLKPVIPKARYLSFYPMDKRRGEANNWYTLDLETRRELMYAHGLIGRQYRGRVQQMITGSIGLDDWEWGVTLYADDPISIKKIVQEMRYDEASARYAEFGPFYFGLRMEANSLASYLSGRPQPAEQGGFAP